MRRSWSFDPLDEHLVFGDIDAPGESAQVIAVVTPNGSFELRDSVKWEVAFAVAKATEPW